MKNTLSSALIALAGLAIGSWLGYSPQAAKDLTTASSPQTPSPTYESKADTRSILRTAEPVLLSNYLYSDLSVADQNFIEETTGNHGLIQLITASSFQRDIGNIRFQRGAFERFCRNNIEEAIMATTGPIRSGDLGFDRWMKFRCATIALEMGLSNWSDPIRDVLIGNGDPLFNRMLADLDPQIALNGLLELPSLPSTDSAIVNVLSGMAATDYNAALKAAETLPGHALKNTATLAILKKALKNPGEGVFDMIAALPPTELRKQLARDAAIRLTELKRPQEAMQWVSDNYITDAATWAQLAVTDVVFRDAPDLALEIAVNIPGAPARNSQNAYIQQWARKDPDALLLWASEQSDDDSVLAAQKFALDAVIQNDASLLPAVLEIVQEPSTRNSVVYQAATSLDIQSQPNEEIRRWISHLPADLQGEAAADIFRSVSYRNPESASALLDSWSGDATVAAPVTEEYVRRLLNARNYQQISDFMKESKRTNPPLFEYAWPSVEQLFISPDQIELIDRFTSPE